MEYERIIELGPRKISRVSRWPVIYLPKELASLHGRKAMVILKLIKT